MNCFARIIKMPIKYSRKKLIEKLTPYFPEINKAYDDFNTKIREITDKINKELNSDSELEIIVDAGGSLMIRPLDSDTRKRIGWIYVGDKK